MAMHGGRVRVVVLRLCTGVHVLIVTEGREVHVMVMQPPVLSAPINYLLLFDVATTSEVAFFFFFLLASVTACKSVGCVISSSRSRGRLTWKRNKKQLPNVGWCFKILFRHQPFNVLLTVQIPSVSVTPSVL